MAFILCEKVRELEPYEPISGSYRIRLDANESYFDLPASVKEEMKAIIDETAFDRYPDPTATELIRAFARYYQIDPAHVTATNGSDEMLYLLSSALLPRGSKVIVTDPDFSMYGFYSFLSENQVISYRKDPRLNIHVEELSALAREQQAAMIIFSNPCNPTGQGIIAEQARKLVEDNRDRLVVLDEAYMDFWDQSLLQEAAQYENLIVLKTASKAIGAAALRLGFAAANETITRALRAVKSPYNVNTLSQKMGTCLYGHRELLMQRREDIVANTRRLKEGLEKLIHNYQLPFTIYPPCANFVFMETEKAQDIYEYLLEESIAVRYFKAASALRITTGSEAENGQLLIALESYILKKLLKRNR